MRIHLQSQPDDGVFLLSPEQWEAACARAPDVSSGHEVTFGHEPGQLEAVLGEVEAIIAEKAAVPRPFPAPTPRLKLVFCTSAGLDNMAPYDWLPPGVALLNNRGTHADKAGEYGIMALLMLANRIPAFATAQRGQEWRKTHASVLRGQRVAVVGLGSLGGAIAGHAKRFGMDVTGVRANPGPHEACDRVVGVDMLDSVLPNADMLVLTPPLTPQTRGLLDRRRIGLLPVGAGVVNMGRGALLDQDALCDALDAGRLGGAVLDVFVPEPVPPGHRLWGTPNLLMTPHMSADDPNTYIPRSLDIFFENMRALRDGRALPNLFDTVRGY